MPNINQALHRKVRSDYPQDIFPKVACKRTILGDGDTFFSVRQIVTTIDTYYSQCDKIAKALKGRTLAITCRNVHNFLYHHFQYKADEEEQQLRSPACSWAQRFSGIDCKSYTILAGAILKAMGYNSYVRQIKQPFSQYPDEYSHVYLLVPASQKDNDLHKGYYVIDGTIPTMQETLFSEKADEIVTAMKHIGLNGAQNALFGFTHAKGLRATSDGNAGKSYEDGKFHKGIGTANKVGNDLLNFTGSLYEGYKKYFGNGSGRTDAAPPPVYSDNSDVIRRQQAEFSAALQAEADRLAKIGKSQEAEKLRMEKEEYERRIADAERRIADAERRTQGYYPNGNNYNEPNKPKDNTILYVAGGLGLLGILAIVIMSNKK